MREIGINTWVWASPLTDENVTDLLHHVADLGFDAVELPLETPGDLSPEVVGAVLAETGLTPYVVGAMAPGRDLVATDPGSVAATQDYLGACTALASSVGARAVCGPFYAATGRVWRMTEDERAAAYARAARVAAAGGRAGGGAGRDDRHRAAQPLRDLAGQHRRPGADRARRRCSARPSAWRWTATTSTSRSGPAPTPSGRPAQHLVHLQVCGSDRGAPGGDQTDWKALLAALDEVGYAGPLEHRELHRRQRRHRHRRLDLAAAGADPGRPGPRRAGVPAVAHRPTDLIRRTTSMAAREPPGCRRDRQRLHGQGPLQRVAQRAGLLPRRAGVRQQVLVGSRRRATRRPAAARTAGPSRPPTGARSSTATTSTSSTCASPGTSTPRWRSPPSRQASTCSSRSRWPTPSPRRRRCWSPPRRPPASAASLDGRLQLPPRAGAGDGPRPVAVGPAGRRAAGQASPTSRTGSPTPPPR